MTPTPATTPPEPVAGRSGAGNHTLTLTVPIHRPLMTSNDQRRAHWTVVRKTKSQTQMLVRAAVQRELPATFDRANVTVTWFAPDGRIRDSDALGPFLKAALDELVHLKILPADDLRHVSSTTQQIKVDRKRPRLEIEITEDTTT